MLWQAVSHVEMFTVSMNLFEVSDFLYIPETPTESMHYMLLAEKQWALWQIHFELN